MFQLFMIFAVATSLARRDSPRSAPIAYYATAMEYADVFSQPPSDSQIQNTLLLLVFAHQHDIGSRFY